MRIVFTHKQKKERKQTLKHLKEISVALQKNKSLKRCCFHTRPSWSKGVSTNRAENFFQSVMKMRGKTLSIGTWWRRRITTTQRHNCLFLLIPYGTVVSHLMRPFIALCPVDNSKKRTIQRNCVRFAFFVIQTLFALIAKRLFLTWNDWVHVYHSSWFHNGV